MLVDMHVHTINSDGRWTEEEIYEWLKNKQEEISKVIVVDHNMISNSKGLGGIEISTKLRKFGRKIHLLAYGYNLGEKLPLDPWLSSSRRVRNNFYWRQWQSWKKKSLRNIKFEELLKGNDRVGFYPKKKQFSRTLAAKVLSFYFDEPLIKETIFPPTEAPENIYPDTERVVSYLNDIGVLSVWAHPFRDRKIENLEVEAIVDYLKLFGLDGIEVNYPWHDEKKRMWLRGLAKKKSLWITGGSDFHGKGKMRIGEAGVSEEEWSEVEKRIREKSKIKRIIKKEIDNEDKKISCIKTWVVYGINKLMEEKSLVDRKKSHQAYFVVERGKVDISKLEATLAVIIFHSIGLDGLRQWLKWRGEGEAELKLGEFLLVESKFLPRLVVKKAMKDEFDIKNEGRMRIYQMFVGEGKRTFPYIKVEEGVVIEEKEVEVIEVTDELIRRVLEEETRRGRRFKEMKVDYWRFFEKEGERKDLLLGKIEGDIILEVANFCFSLASLLIELVVEEFEWIKMAK